MLFTSILQTIKLLANNKTLSIKVNNNEKNKDVLNNTSNIDNGSISKSVKNLLSNTELTKFKTSNYTIFQNLDLAKIKIFVKVNTFKTDFLIFKTRKIFIYL